jgi:hypothetical protein
VGHADGVGEGALAGDGSVEADDDAVLERRIARVAWLFSTGQGIGRRRIGDRPLAVRGFGEFVTGHGCLGVVILRRGRQSAAELCPGMVFPSPYPEEYGGTPVKPRPRALSVAVHRSMHDRRP